MSETIVAFVFLLGHWVPPFAVLASASLLFVGRSSRQRSARPEAASHHHSGVAA